MKLINEILERKIFGQDCTEQESAELKGFVRQQHMRIGEPNPELVKQIEELFPCEHDEAITEYEDDPEYWIKVYSPIK